MTSPYAPYDDIMAFADECLKTATNEQIKACYGLTMEDDGDIIAQKIRSELFRRRREQEEGRHNKGPGRKARKAAI